MSSRVSLKVVKNHLPYWPDGVLPLRGVVGQNSNLIHCRSLSRDSFWAKRWRLFTTMYTACNDTSSSISLRHLHRFSIVRVALKWWCRPRSSLESRDGEVWSRKCSAQIARLGNCSIICKRTDFRRSSAVEHPCFSLQKKQEYSVFCFLRVARCVSAKILLARDLVVTADATVFPYPGGPSIHKQLDGLLVLRQFANSLRWMSHS